MLIPVDLTCVSQIGLDFFCALSFLFYKLGNQELMGQLTKNCLGSQCASEDASPRDSPKSVAPSLSKTHNGLVG